MTIDAIVVTCNRYDELVKCINRLLKITLKNIFVIDNASDDGTAEYLDDLDRQFDTIHVFHLKRNIGGAGGFNYGIKKFISRSKSDYVWVMDDDAVPSKEALKKLSVSLDSLEEKSRGFSVGTVLWKDGSIAKMNVPKYKSANSSKSNNREVSEASFVGILFFRKAIQKVGFPISDFFIWGDDIEYTRRMVAKGYIGLQVQDAVVVHNMASNNNTNILNENSNVSRIRRYYYDFRNRIYLSRQISAYALIKTLLGRIIWGGRILVCPNQYKLLKLKVLIKGTVDGVRFHPQIENVETR